MLIPYSYFLVELEILLRPPMIQARRSSFSTFFLPLGKTLWTQQRHDFLLCTVGLASAWRSGKETPQIRKKTSQIDNFLSCKHYLM